MKKETKNSVANLTARANRKLPAAKHNPGAKRCFIVDGHHMAYRAYYVHRNFRYKGKPTGIMYGVINMIKSIIFQERPEKVIVCWDGNKHPKRLKLLSDYKGHRQEKEPAEKAAFIKQIQRTQRMLTYLGIPQVYNPEVEGDDMIYLLTKKLVNLYPITIFSGDKDFKQLINKDVDVMHPQSKYRDGWYEFFLHAKVEVWQYVDYLCLVGDSSDDIKGYAGIGPVRAAKFLNTFESIRVYLKDKKAEFSGMTDKRGLKKLYKRNKRLIDLKWFNDRYHSEKEITYIKGRANPELELDNFITQCNRFGLKTFLFPNFHKPFIQLNNA